MGSTPVAPTPVDPSQNPYSQMLNTDGPAGQAIQNANAQSTSAIDSQINAYGGTPADGGGNPAYPTMANSYGLGTSAPIPGSASNPAFGSQPITVSVPDTSSRGFNPWSLTGEANARGK